MQMVDVGIEKITGIEGAIRELGDWDPEEARQTCWLKENAKGDDVFSERQGEATLGVGADDIHEFGAMAMLATGDDVKRFAELEFERLFEPGGTWLVNNRSRKGKHLTLSVSADEQPKIGTGGLAAQVMHGERTHPRN